MMQCRHCGGLVDFAPFLDLWAGRRRPILYLKPRIFPVKEKRYPLVIRHLHRLSG